MGLERVFQQPVSNEITVKVLTLDQEPVSVKLDRNDSLAVAKVNLLHFLNLSKLIKGENRIDISLKKPNQYTAGAAEDHFLRANFDARNTSNQKYSKCC